MSYRYGITLLIDGKECEFELLKDGFSKNKVVAHRGAWRKKVYYKILYALFKMQWNWVAKGLKWMFG